MLAASLTDVGVGVDLGNVLSGLDRKPIDLVLAAMAHAGESHEHSDFVVNLAGERVGFQKLASRKERAIRSSLVTTSGRWELKEHPQASASPCLKARPTMCVQHCKPLAPRKATPP
ncbi:hypothetical protein MB46_19955 (plasmid) [Arthrobacter alpinus]|nr:hypothetical protein MB46_19155 [Arthrobacter alpinus]ALV47941.1 hypothetical protein MB46_19955 [Arthrobacter alpinus]